MMRPSKDLPCVYLCTHPVDFCKAIGGLSVLVENELALNPFDSTLFVFVNRRKDKIKILCWEKNGFCLWYKRLEKHPDTLPNDVEALKKVILGQQQQIALTLEETLRLERFNRFGASSEKAPGQGELFNEAEDCIDDTEDESTNSDSMTEQTSASAEKVKPKRKPLPSNLPRVRKVFEFPESELQCLGGCTLTEIGE